MAVSHSRESLCEFPCLDQGKQRKSRIDEDPAFLKRLSSSDASDDSVTLLALAGSGLLAALLVAAGAERKGRRREGDDGSDLGDVGHGSCSPPFFAGCFFQQCIPTFQIAKEKPDRL
jgi:hypothetical protein